MLCVTYVLSSLLMNMDYYFYIINVLFSCLWKFRLSACNIFSLNKRTTNIQKLTEIVRCVYIYAVACLILGMGLLIHGSTCCMPITIRIKLPTREKLQNRYIIFHEQRTTQTYIPLLFLFQLVLPVFVWTFVSGKYEWENHLKTKYDSISVSWEFLHGVRQRLLSTGTWDTIGH